MTDKRHFVLSHDVARKTAAACCLDPEYAGYHVEIREPTRNLEQSAKFHAICGDIAKQKEFMGKMRTPEEWKLLLISAHRQATGGRAEVVAGLEGEWVNLRESTARMSVKRISSLIEYATAWAIGNGVKLGDTIEPKL